MKKQHQTFVDAMAEHGDPVKAYITAYPKVKETSARAAAYRLLQHPEISKAVTFDAAHMHKKAKAVALKKGTKRVAQELADIQKRREVLAQMIFGTRKRKRFFKLDGEIVWVDDDIPSHSVLRAIELDCKLEAGFDWTGRRTAGKKEKEEPLKAGPQNPVSPHPEDITGTIVLIGDTLFAKEDAEWIERYAAWKKENPAKVKEWVVDIKNIRYDTYIEWTEDPVGFPRASADKSKSGIIQILRFCNGLPDGPFIPGSSRYFTSYEEQDAAYGIKPFKAPAPTSQPGNPNSPFEEGHLAGNLNSPFEGGHLAAGKMGGCPHNTGQATPHTQIQNNPTGQQSVTFQPLPNPPQDANMQQTHKVYYTSEEIWEDYIKLLPAWPHLAEKTKRALERSFKESSLSDQRQRLRMRKEVMRA
jgi:hypothetical protein